MKIADKINEKFWNFKPFSQKHDRIEVIENEILYSYRGNTVAKLNFNSGYLQISDAGWSSNTTKNRLNAILANTDFNIVQRKGIWYIINRIDNKTIEWNGDWFEIKTKII